MKFKVKTTRKLLPQQKQYLDWSKKFTHPACIMQMRLGKTLAKIRWAQDKFRAAYRIKSNRSFPAMVVAPTSVIATWEKELEEEGEEYIVVHGKTFDKRTEMVVNRAHMEKGRIIWVLINYDSLRETPGLSFLPWFIVILDESPVIKNPKAKISKLCTLGFRDAEHRSILSGSPRTESELDLFQQYKFLHGSFMGCTDFWQYRAKFFDIREWGGWELLPGKYKLIKEAVHSKSFVLTRKDVGAGSLKAVRSIRYVPMTQEQRRVYNKIETLFVADTDKGEIETDLATTRSIWLSRVCGGFEANAEVFKWPGKVDELITLLKGELTGEPVVIGCDFNAEIFELEKRLKKAKIPCVTLTGADSREERKRKQNWFTTCKTPGRAIISQIRKVAQYGVDMSVSDTMIFYSVVPSCDQMTQFMDRIVHPLKKNTLLYIFLAMQDSRDEDVIETVQDKIMNSKLFLRKMEDRMKRRIEKRETI